MNSITQVIRKVATAVRKTVLIGALVGGVSMIASATETTETKVGPTIEKAQLETVEINLDAVVAAITKVDPDWVKGLPRVKPEKVNTTEVATKSTSLNTVIWVFEGGLGDILDTEAYTPSPNNTPPNDCDAGDDLPCYLLLDSDDEQ